jgi:hypothetical protein
MKTGNRFHAAMIAPFRLLPRMNELSSVHRENANHTPKKD